MRKLILLPFLITLLCMGTQAYAASELKIGILNTQRIISESIAGKEGNKNLNALLEKHKKEIEAKGAEIQKDESDLEKQYLTMTESARNEKEESIKRAKKAFNRMREDAELEVGNMEKTLLNDMLTQLGSIIEQIGKEEGFSLILGNDGPTVLYSDTSVDVTDKVIKVFNEKWTSSSGDKKPGKE